MKRLILVVSSLALFMMAGCLGPALQSMDTMLAGSQGRVKLLTKAVEKFHQAVYWSSTEGIQRFVQPSEQEKVKGAFTGPDKAKILKIDVTDTRYKSDYHEAEVDVSVHRFGSRTLTVEEFVHTELWQFERIKGWQLVNVQIDGSVRKGDGAGRKRESFDIMNTGTESNIE